MIPPKNYKNQKEQIPRELYSAIHYYIKKKYGVATKCENKKCLGKSTCYQWAKLPNKPYDFKRANFKQLCRSCHSKQDITEKTRERMREVNPNTNKTHCINGHELSPENVHIYRKTERHCKLCMSARAKNRCIKMMFCSICEKEFCARYKHTRFCSKSCAKKHDNATRKLKKLLINN